MLMFSYYGYYHVFMFSRYEFMIIIMFSLTVRKKKKTIIFYFQSILNTINNKELILLIPLQTLKTKQIENNMMHFVIKTKTTKTYPTR